MVLPDAVPATRRRAQTRRRLLDAALESFAELGYGRATVEDVAARAGYTRGAFYSNFSSLGELFLALAAERAEHVVAAAQEGVRAAQAEVVDGLSLSVERVVEHVVAVLPGDRRWFLAQSEFTTQALREPDVAAALVAQRTALRAALVPVLRLVVPAAPSDERLDQLARAVVAISEGMLSQSLVEPGDETLPLLRRRLLLAALAVLDEP